MKSFSEETCIERPTLEIIAQRAQQVKSRIEAGGGMALPDIIDAVVALLQNKDVKEAQVIFKQLPETAYNHPRIVALFLRYLVQSGEVQQAERFAAEIRRSNPAMEDTDLAKLLNQILAPLPEPEELPDPLVLDYQFDLQDGHYSMKMLLECPYCGSAFVAKTGWGIMVLRPAFCTACLKPSLISPEFLVDVLKKYHSSDGNRGLRDIDQQIFNTVGSWHLADDFPEEGYRRGVNLGEPMMLRIQRLLVRELYLEKYINIEGAAS